VAKARLTNGSEAGGSAAQAPSESAIRAGARAAASSLLPSHRRALGEACIGIILGGAASSRLLRA
jgi:hypothetical protein